MTLCALCRPLELSLIHICGADTTLQYNLITYVFNPIGTTLAMYYASKKGSTKAMRLGFFTFIFLYAFFLCVMDAAVWFMPVIAFLVSWAGGYYWMGYCIKVPLYTTDENRDVSLSVIGMGTGIVNLIMPTITGAVSYTHLDVYKRQGRIY